LSHSRKCPVRACGQVPAVVLVGLDIAACTDVSHQTAVRDFNELVAVVCVCEVVHQPVCVSVLQSVTLQGEDVAHAVVCVLVRYLHKFIFFIITPQI